MTCPRCHDRDDSGPVCTCGRAAVDAYHAYWAARNGPTTDETGGISTPHSRMNAAQATREARRLGDPSDGDGWRRLLFRMAQLLEDDNGKR